MQWFQSLSKKGKILLAVGLITIVIIAIIVAFLTQTSTGGRDSSSKIRLTPPPLPPPPNEDVTNPQLIWNITFHFDSTTKTLGIVSIETAEGFAPDYLIQPQQGYRLYILDDTKKSLFTLTFSEPTIIGEYGTSPSAFDFWLTIPYYTEGETIEIFDPLNRPIESKDLPKKNLGSSLLPKAYAQSYNLITIRPRQCTGNALNLFFIGQGFSSDSQFTTTVQNHINALINTPPFASYQQIFEVTGVNVPQDIGCINGISNIGPSFTCISAADRISQPYPSDVTMVLINQTGTNARAQFPPASWIVYGTAIQPTNPEFPSITGDKVLVHEIGHALGNLYDQYTYRSSPPFTVWPGRNCATTEQERVAWHQQYPGIIGVEGCTIGSYYRATKNGSVMNTPVFNWSGQLHYDVVEDDLWQPILSTYANQCQPSITLTPTPSPTPNITPTPTSTPTPTPIPYVCYEEPITPMPGKSLQLRRLICTTPTPP